VNGIGNFRALSARVRDCICAATVVAVCAVFTTPRRVGADQTPDLSTRAVVRQTASYVERYQRDFAFLVADEDYRQHVDYNDGRPSQTRRLRGEMFVTYLESDRAWTAVHDIAEVDGQPIPDRDDLRELLSQSSVSSIATRVFSRNARYNLGSIVRTFNDPLLSLVIFSDRHIDRFSFERRAIDRQNGTVLVELTFKEKERPTLVRTIDGLPIFLHGTLSVDPATGTIHRAQVQIDDAIKVLLDTTFAMDVSVQRWVPTSFNERYEALTPHEVVTGQATFRNYRKFQVTGRIK